jgi:hypothetical protein
VSRPVPDGLEEAAVRKAHRDTGATTLTVLGIDTKARFIELGNALGDTVTYHWRTSGKRIRLFPLVDPAASSEDFTAAKPIEIGSEQWALSWRADMQDILENIPGPFIKFSQYWDVGEEHDVWRLLSKPDGSYFESFDEFYLAKEPWGLGATPGEVERWLGIGRVEEALELARGMNPDELVALAAEIKAMADDEVAAE